MGNVIKLLLFILNLYKGIITILTHKLTGYLLGPTEYGDRAIRSGIALVIIGLCFAYSYFKKRWKALAHLFKLLHPFPFILIFLFGITLFLDYLHEIGKSIPVWLLIISLTLAVSFVFVFHYELEQYRKDQNPDKDGG